MYVCDLYNIFRHEYNNKSKNIRNNFKISSCIYIYDHLLEIVETLFQINNNYLTFVFKFKERKKQKPGNNGESLNDKVFIYISNIGKMHSSNSKKSIESLTSALGQ